jgi:ATP:corrinoid adenosyltransferase
MAMFLWLSIACIVVGLLLVATGKGHGWSVAALGVILFVVWMLKNPFTS